MTKPKQETTLVTDCDCHDPAHLMQFYLDAGFNGEPPELYVSCQLNPLWGFWGRLWNAVRYVVGRQSRYGHWSEGSISPESAEKLVGVLAGFISDWRDFKSGNTSTNALIDFTNCSYTETTAGQVNVGAN